VWRRATAALLAREERRRCDLADEVVVTSELERDRLGRVAPPVTVVPNTVQEAPVADPSRGDALILVGSLDYEPNIDALRRLVVSILPLIRQEISDARLIVAGRNPTAEVVQLAETAGAELRPNVPDLDGVYARARAVVVPIRLGGGTRFKILEAMARGLAIVATPEAIEGIDVTAGRDFAVGAEDEQFAAACVELLRDPVAATRLGQAARVVWTRAYRPEVAVERIHEVLARTRRPPGSSR
jgi:glycosyltransferase involved in cell wall biosynthesis